MRKFYEALLKQYREVHDEVVKALDLLPAEALDWSPGPGMNTISVLVTHLTGAERYWIGDVVTGEPSFRNREAEFQVKGADHAALKKRLSDLDAYEAQALEKLRVRDLETWKVSPRDGNKVLTAEALLHALEHSAVHLGHIEILVQQWRQKQPA
jgi:uncharacterized damage-inducible protein DinB